MNKQTTAAPQSLHVSFPSSISNGLLLYVLFLLLLIPHNNFPVLFFDADKALLIPMG